MVLSAVQCTLRRNGTDALAGLSAHRYGKSVFNQVSYRNGSSLTCISYFMNELDVLCSF